MLTIFSLYRVPSLCNGYTDSEAFLDICRTRVDRATNYLEKYLCKCLDTLSSSQAYIVSTYLPIDNEYSVSIMTSNSWCLGNTALKSAIPGILQTDGVVDFFGHPRADIFSVSRRDPGITPNPVRTPNPDLLYFLIFFITIQPIDQFTLYKLDIL